MIILGILYISLKLKKKGFTSKDWIKSCLESWSDAAQVARENDEHGIGGWGDVRWNSIAGSRQQSRWFSGIAIKNANQVEIEFRREGVER